MFNSNFARLAQLPTTDVRAAPIEVGARLPWVAVDVVRDSVRVLSAFAWGKQARLSRNKSAELCSLLNRLD